MTPVTIEPRVFQSRMSLMGTAEVLGDQLKFSVWWPRTLMLYPIFKTIKETIIPLNRIANVSRSGDSILFDWIQDDGVARRVEFHADGFDNAAQLASQMQAAQLTRFSQFVAASHHRQRHPPKPMFSTLSNDFTQLAVPPDFAKSENDCTNSLFRCRNEMDRGTQTATSCPNNG